MNQKPSCKFIDTGNSLPWFHMLLQMAWHDLRARYAGAVLGLVWNVTQPLVMAVVLWLVIGFGMRTHQISGLPYIVWLLPGMAAWSFFAESLNTATPVLYEYEFLVKKVRFPVIILPPMKIIATLVSHLVFLAITIIALIINGVKPTLSWLLLPYFTIGLMVLAFGLAWITAALHALTRDIGHIVGILLQFGFWLTPVFWSPDMIGDRRLELLLKLNPMVYIVQGYRQSLAFGDISGLNPAGAAWFWSATLIILFSSLLLFRRLRPHFADTL